MSAETEFLDKVKANRREEVERAVAENPALAGAQDANGVSAVLWATYHGHRDLAGWLANHGATLNIFEAAAIGRPELVEKMLGDNPGLKDEYSPDGFRPLGLACFFGHTEIVEQLLRAGADVNSASRNQMRVAPIHSAAANRDPKIALRLVTMLVEHGAEVNVQQHGGWTPLQQAEAHKNTELVQFLTDHGAQ